MNTIKEILDSATLKLNFSSGQTMDWANTLVRSRGGTFTRPSDKWVINKAGILEPRPAGFPAVEFDGAFNKGYLAEPSATNLVTQESWIFDSVTGWSVSVGSSTREDTDEDSFLGGRCMLVKFDATQSFTIITTTNSAFSISAGQTRTLSCWMKKKAGSSDLVIMSARIQNSGGTALSSPSETKTITSEWKKYRFTFTAPADSSAHSIRFQGNNYDTEFYVDCIQLESGLVDTSFVPHNEVGQTVTRPADSLVFTGAQDLIGQTSGVMLVKVNLDNNDTFVIRTIMGISDGTPSNRISLRKSTDQRIALIIVNSGSVSASVQSSTNQFGFFNVAVVYGINRLDLFINGVKLTNTSSGTLPSFSRIDVGKIEGTGTTNFLNDTIKSAYLWNNADWITDELAQTLTR
jgi:hypothetical protein